MNNFRRDLEIIEGEQQRAIFKEEYLSDRLTQIKSDRRALEIRQRQLSRDVHELEKILFALYDEKLKRTGVKS